MFNKHDLVRIIRSTDSIYNHFIGAEGVIIGVRIGYDHPYQILFLDDKLRAEEKADGGILWKDSEIEGV